MGKIFIITGKGGVGKTSVAAAHAVRSADEGINTLLISADMAHNLGDIFQVEAGGSVKQIAPCLSLLELDPYLLMKEEYPDVNKALANLSGSSGAALSEVADSYMIPGFENLFSLLKIRDLYRSGEYGRIIVDCAPTGETLTLLKLPELLSWYVEKFSPVGRMITRILTPVAKLRYRMDLPDGRAMDELGRLFRDLVSLQEILKDPEICRVRLVSIPERMVVEETRRSYMYLNLYNYPVDTLFRYIKELESVFTELPVCRIPWFPMEIRGMEAVKHLCASALGDEDLFDRPVRTDNEVYEKLEGGICSLTVRIPGGEREDVQIFVRDMDVDIRIRNFMRSIPLPGVLRGARMTSYQIRDGVLTIYLAPKQ